MARPETGLDRGTEEASGAERRRGLRIRQIRPVKIHDPGACRYFGGQTHDISTTGLRVALPAASPVREGRLLNVHVGLSDSGEALANRRQMMPARVVWVDRQSDPQRRTLTIGVEFLSSIAARLDAA